MVAVAIVVEDLMVVYIDVAVKNLTVVALVIVEDLNVFAFIIVEDIDVIFVVVVEMTVVVEELLLLQKEKALQYVIEH